MKKSHISFALLTALLAGCSSAPKWHDSSVTQKDTRAFSILINQISDNIQDIWGQQEILIAGPKDYVQYSSDQKTRVHINFVSGLITIETLNHDATTSLRSAIVSTLLLPEPVDVLNANIISDSHEEPFLYHQVVDNSGNPIRWPWRARRFADYLLTHELKTRHVGTKTITCVNIHLVPNHVDERARKFLPIIRAAAQRYQLDENLVLSIIKVESNYNPYAVSPSDALGLMQVQQHTAGRDLYRSWGKAGEPGRSFLLDPKNNIYMGCAYLALIRDKYLTGIVHPVSLRHAMIAAYNGGAGSVLRTFSPDRRTAITKINQLEPRQVFRKLAAQHFSLESRRYLIKVNEHMKK